MNLIGLHGPIGAGKDTVAAYLYHRHNYSRIAFAGPIKDMLMHGLGLRREHFTNRQLKEKPITGLGVSPRDLMRSLGDWGRQQSPDFWIRLAERRRNYTAPYFPKAVFIDVRLPEESDWLRRRGGVLWHILRPQNTPQHLEPGTTHSTDQALPLQRGDSVLINDTGIDQLHLTIELALQGELTI